MRRLPIREFQKVLRSRNPKAVVIFIILAGLAYWLQSEKANNPGDRISRGQYTGTCINVIDGDTLDVQSDSGGEYRLRILGVDCMDTFNESKITEQADRLQRPVSEIKRLGELAHERVRDLTLNMPVTWEIPEGTPIHDPYDRILAYVEIDGIDVGELLLREGLAELRRDPHPRSNRYRSVAKPLLR